jgi:hypothetical protein
MIILCNNVLDQQMRNFRQTYLHQTHDQQSKNIFALASSILYNQLYINSLLSRCREMWAGRDGWPPWQGGGWGPYGQSRTFKKKKTWGAQWQGVVQPCLLIASPILMLGCEWAYWWWLQHEGRGLIYAPCSPSPSTTAQTCAIILAGAYGTPPSSPTTW